MTRRETALNVFLGAVLLCIFGLILAAAFAGIILAFRGLNRALLHVFPSASLHTDAALLLVFGVILLLLSAWDLYRRCWRRAFVDFAVSLSIFLTSSHLVQFNRHIDFPSYFTMLLVLNFSMTAGKKQDMERNRFLFANTLLGLAILSALGFLGSLHDLVSIFLIVVATGWWLIENQREPSKPGVPLSPPTP